MQPMTVATPKATLPMIAPALRPLMQTAGPTPGRQETTAVQASGLAQQPAPDWATFLETETVGETMEDGGVAGAAHHTPHITTITITAILAPQITPVAGFLQVAILEITVAVEDHLAQDLALLPGLEALPGDDLHRSKNSLLCKLKLLLSISKVH